MEGGGRPETPFFFLLAILRNGRRAYGEKTHVDVLALFYTLDHRQSKLAVHIVVVIGP